MESTDTVKARHKKLGDVMQGANLNALALNPGPSLVYFTGLNFHLSERPVVVFMLPDPPPIIVLPELENAKVQNLPYPITAYPYGEDPNTWVDAFKEAAQKANLKWGQVGVESRWLRFLELQFLEAALPHTIFAPADEVIASLRMFKDEQEIAYMQQAVDIAQDALEATLPNIKIGITEAEIAAILSIQLIQFGSNPKLPFFPIVSGGLNSANPHASPSDHQLAAGDLLVIDYGANVGGYYSDITRTFAIGEVNPECQHIAAIVIEANEAGRQAVKPGVTASSVDDTARSVIEEAGYGKFFIHRTGHGLGLEVHEDPYIRSDNDMVLQVGMTFTVEPGIYLPNRFGVRVEDDVVVTPEGGQSLTSLPRELITLPLV